MLHKHTGERSGLHEEKGVYVFNGWISRAMTAGTKRSKVLSLTPVEHGVDGGSCGFSPAGGPCVGPQVEDQPMNPDDTVHVPEEVGVEGGDANPARGVPSRTQPTRKEIQEHALTHLPPRSWCGHCLSREE